MADIMEYGPDSNIMPNFEAASLVPTEDQNNNQSSPMDTEGANSNCGTETSNVDGLLFLCQFISS